MINQIAPCRYDKRVHAGLFLRVFSVLCALNEMVVDVNSGSLASFGWTMRFRGKIFSCLNRCDTSKYSRNQPDRVVQLTTYFKRYEPTETKAKLH
jgi:hypothetical protein